MRVSFAIGPMGRRAGIRVGKQVEMLQGNSLSEANLGRLSPLTSRRVPGTFRGSVRDSVLSEFFRTRFS